MTSRNGGIMLILSSPSGAGKTTLTKKIQQKYQNFKISVSHTTRKPRPNEVEGIDYFFVSHEEFKKKISKNEFYEHAKIFDNYYGTSRNSVNSLLKDNNNILFDIDWQGTQQLSKFDELKLVKVFLLPPNKKELENRLIQRNQDNLDIISKRLKAYDNDIHHWSDYDHVIINDNLEHCFSQIEKIILSEENRYT
jgi:guanylate kinase